MLAVASHEGGRLSSCARQEPRRTSSSDSGFEYQHKRKESKHSKKKHSKHHPSTPQKKGAAANSGFKKRYFVAYNKADKFVIKYFVDKKGADDPPTMLSGP